MESCGTICLLTYKTIVFLFNQFVDNEKNAEKHALLGSKWRKPYK